MKIVAVFMLVALVVLTYLIVSRYKKARKRDNEIRSFYHWMSIVLNKVRVSPFNRKYHVVEKLEKYNYLLISIARSFNKRNGHSYERNITFALISILGLLAFFISVSAVCFLVAPVWYVGLSYAVSWSLIAVIFFLITLRSYDRYFTVQYPLMLTYVGSRFRNDRRIENAIRVSIEDMPPSMAKLLREILDIFSMSRGTDADARYLELEKRYDNKYTTRFLTMVRLIQQRGGGEAVNKQFDVLVEDINSDINNEKDLSSSSRTYIVVVCIFVPLGVRSMENYMGDIVGTGGSFYNGPVGYMMKSALYLTMMVYAAYMYYLENRKVV